MKRTIKTINETAAWLRERDGFLLLTHIRPDGDTLGSAAALAAGLRRAGKRAYLLKNDGATPRYVSRIGAYFAPPDYVPDWVVSVDTASVSMYPENAQPYKDRTALSIDHHGSNEGYAENVCVAPERAACGEIVLDLLDAAGIALTPEIAELLYIALSTDTGCFCYANTTAQTLAAAARLVRAGADNARLNKEFFRTKAKSRMEIEGGLLSNLRFYRQGTIAVTCLTLEMIGRTGATEDDLENIASIPAEIEGVAVGVTVRELAPGRSKISLRSSEEVDSSAVCARFGGGGHACAAGCSIDETPDRAAAMLVDALEQNWK